MNALSRSLWLLPLGFALACGGGEVAPVPVVAPPPPPPVVVAPPPVEVPAPAAAEGSATEAKVEPKAATPSAKTTSTAKTASRTTPEPEVDLLAEDPASTGSGSRPTDAAEEDELLLEDLDAPPPPVTKPRGSGVTKTRPK